MNAIEVVARRNVRSRTCMSSSTSCGLARVTENLRAHAERRSELRECRLLLRADLCPADAEEAAFLRRFGSLACDRHQPRGEFLRLRRGLRGDSGRREAALLDERAARLFSVLRHGRHLGTRAALERFT